MQNWSNILDNLAPPNYWFPHSDIRWNIIKSHSLLRLCSFLPVRNSLFFFVSWKYFFCSIAIYYSKGHFFVAECPLTGISKASISISIPNNTHSKSPTSQVKTRIFHKKGTMKSLLKHLLKFPQNMENLDMEKLQIQIKLTEKLGKLKFLLAWIMKCENAMKDFGKWSTSVQLYLWIQTVTKTQKVIFYEFLDSLAICSKFIIFHPQQIAKYIFMF
jgi:hypothetical protein